MRVIRKDYREADEGLMRLHIPDPPPVFVRIALQHERLSRWQRLTRWLRSLLS